MKLWNKGYCLTVCGGGLIYMCRLGHIQIAISLKLKIIYRCGLLVVETLTSCRTKTRIKTLQ